MKKIIRKVVLAMSIPLAISLISCENPSGSSGNSTPEKETDNKTDKPAGSTTTDPAGSTTEKPAEGTTTKPSEGTTPEQSQSGGETTKPEQGQDQPGGETTKPEEGQSGGETTKPKEDQSGGETTKPEEGQSGGETTKPEEGQSGGETTKPEQGQDQSGGGSEIPQVTKYTVTFDRDDGTTVVSREIESGKTVTQPEAPTRAGFVFKGWYSGNTKYEFTTPVTGTLTLKAKWAESGIFSSEGAFFIYIDESTDPSSLGTAW